MLSSGFTRLLDRLRNRMSEGMHGPPENLEVVIREIIHFAYRNPHLFELMRTISGQETINDSNWRKKRMELRSLIESIIRQGIGKGEFTDLHPELTARFIPVLVRSVMIEAAPVVDRQTLTAHILCFVKAALTRKQQ